MADKKSADEQPKRKIAKRVVAEKRQYFVPDCGITVEADSAAEAVEVARSELKSREDGDV